MNRTRFLLAGFFLGAALFCGGAKAATVEGTLILNEVSATLWPYIGVPSGTVSFSATAYVQVCTPSISLDKRANSTVQSAGGVVTFCINIANNSNCTSAFSLIVSDWLPDNMAYVNTDRMWVDGGTVGYGYWLPDVMPPVGLWFWPNSKPAPGTTGNVELFWWIDMVGIGRTGYVCFQASVL